MTDDPHATTRRTVLTASGSLALLATAGCLSDDENGDSGDDHDHDHDDDHSHDDNDHGHDDDDHGHDDDDHGHDDEEYFDHLGIDEFDVIDRSDDEQIAYIHGDHWHGNLPSIPVGETLSLGASVLDEDGDEIELGDEYELRVDAAPDEPEDFLEFDYHGDHVHLIGESVGVTEVVFSIWHDDHADYQTPPITAQVVEEGDDDHDEYDIATFEILDRSQDPHEVVADVNGDHWHGDLPEIPLDDNVSLGASVEDGDGEEIPLGSEYELHVVVADDAEEDIVEIDPERDYHGDHVHIYGESEGETQLVFQLVHDDHVDYETPEIDATVVDE